MAPAPNWLAPQQYRVEPPPNRSFADHAGPTKITISAQMRNRTVRFLRIIECEGVGMLGPRSQYGVRGRLGCHAPEPITTSRRVPKMVISPDDWSAVRLTLALAGVVTASLLLLATPIAWWLAHSSSRWRGPISALVTLPLVLPPTVLGFYLLVAMGSNGPIGRLTQALGLGLLPFHFSGLVVASVLYSMPFVVQPIRNAFEASGKRPLEVAACLHASPLDAFFRVALPLARPGLLIGAILGFAHTLGEFGVVLMIGGNIPGETRVLSMQIYNHVEALEYSQAHWLAGALMAISFLVLMAIYLYDPKRRMF